MSSNAQKFLDAAYTELDFSSGDLVSSDTPRSQPQWIEKGDWIDLTKKVGADRIFFVNENPVIVFAKKDTDDPETLRQLFKKIWCMSRPNILFLATPGALSVYDLNEPPEKTPEDWQKREPLDVVKNIADVANGLKAYHRAQIESGMLFEDERFRGLETRADRSLIQDLRTLRIELMKKGLKGKKLKYAHSLIGRSIFIRYLEDRKILSREYFLKVAQRGKGWKAILDYEPVTPYAEKDMGELCYLKVLSDKDFTYALFDQLSKDFNGDMFPEDQEERQVVKQKHLDLLQGFLIGDPGPQQKLFFWAYKFDIIPIELISSIYEEFYKGSDNIKDGKGTYYTPSALVNFLLSQVLTPDLLDKSPRILDAACGSGIFLVESLRRIVRYRMHKQNGRLLDARQLRKIMREQIQGIDVNEEAIRVAAFSLYLALLHYQKRPDIIAQMDKGYCLPNLIKGNGRNRKTDSFDILLASNAFADEVDLTADVVVGNPPWGSPYKKDQEATRQLNIAIDWCSKRKYPVGDKEHSQAFIWRVIDCLDKGGIAALLASTGIFYKHHPNSKEFRRKFLQNTKLHQVVNFAHVRKIFFPNAIAPFASIIFEKNIPSQNHRFMYASAKRTAIINSLQSVILSQPDISFLNQHQIQSNDAWWKIYWWGNHNDMELINTLKVNDSFDSLVDKNLSGRGYERCGSTIDSQWLKKYKELPVEEFIRYGKLNLNALKDVPNKVYRLGKEGAYHGDRLLIKRGISERVSPKGQIIARYESIPFCFSNAIFGAHLLKSNKVTYKLLLGIFWSSLARYYFFLTSSKWGMWRHEIYNEEILSMPVYINISQSLQSRIVKIVNELRNCSNNATFMDSHKLRDVEKELDNAIFELYELDEPQQDLILDMCEVGIQFFYDPVKSKAAKPIDLNSLAFKQGRMDDLTDDPKNRVDINGYLRTFLRIWNRELEPDGEFVWRIISPNHFSPMLMIVFSAQPKRNFIKTTNESDDQAWLKLLRRLGSDLQVPYHSERIYIDGLVRAVTQKEIIIIKRNEGRFWTRSMAREDAEATILKAINLESVK